MDRHKLLRYAEAAKFLGLAEATCRRYVSLGLLPHIKLGRKLVAFREADLNAWLDQHVVPAKDCPR